MIEFKSISCYFDAEKSGLKNNTIRKIDMKDGRFLQLLEMIRRNRYDLAQIRITRAELPNDSFVRQIRHITKWNDFLIITWRC